MKPTQKKVKIWPSKEEPVITRGNGYLGKHASEQTVLIPLEPIRDDREI